MTLVVLWIIFAIVAGLPPAGWIPQPDGSERYLGGRHWVTALKGAR